MVAPGRTLSSREAIAGRRWRAREREVATSDASSTRDCKHCVTPARCPSECGLVATPSLAPRENKVVVLSQRVRKTGNPIRLLGLKVSCDIKLASFPDAPPTTREGASDKH